MNSWVRKLSKIVFENPWLKVREDITERNGKEINYTVIERNNSVTIIPLSENNYTLLIKQLRYPTQEFSLELPAGGIMEGEDPEKAALRELKEETGLVPQEIIKIAQLYPHPAISAQKAHIFIAKLSYDQLNQAVLEDNNEAIVDYKVLPLDEVYKLVSEGQITDGFTLATLMVLKEFLRDK